MILTREVMVANLVLLINTDPKTRQELFSQLRIRNPDTRYRSKRKLRKAIRRILRRTSGWVVAALNCSKMKYYVSNSAW